MNTKAEEIFDGMTKENYQKSIDKLYDIADNDRRKPELMTEREKEIYSWLSDDVFYPDRVEKIQDEINERELI